MQTRTRLQLTAYHQGKISLTDQAIDGLLGIRPEPIERSLRLGDLLKRFGPASFDASATPYATVRTLLHWCAPGPGDVLCDLGSGHGRVVLYGAALSAASFRGIELLPERAAAAERCRSRLGLANAQLIAADARVADLRDNNLFFLANPFSRSTLACVGDRLRQVAACRDVCIASWAQSNDYFARQAWLVEITPGDAPARRFGLRLFASRPSAADSPSRRCPARLSGA